MFHPTKRLAVLSATLVALNLASAQTLPPSMIEELARARVPLDAVSLLVSPVDFASPPLLSHRATAPMNPASVMKLVTTFAGLELLGPGFTWRTLVWIDGKIEAGVAKGNLVIQGQGDPKLVIEKLWLLLRRVQALGVKKIAGDIVLDRRAFAPNLNDSAQFDGEPLRPYNATPDALLINFKSVVMTFTPDPVKNVAHVQYDPPLWGVRMPGTVTLSANKAANCGDYRGALKADFSDPGQIRFDGHYPSTCGEKMWPLAYSDPASYNARAIQGLWQNMGGELTGKVRDGIAPATAATFEVTSPTLTELIRDINKFSNNVMAQQLFLTLGRSALVPATSAPATNEAAREAVRQWWYRRIAPELPVNATHPNPLWPPPLIDNGAGLSRQSRITASSLTRMLQVAYASPVMPELMSSLPIVGIDGTLLHSRAKPSSAHLKTGSLKDVLARAGYVQTPDGRQFCLVAFINHPNASAAKPALDALVDWTAAQKPYSSPANW